MRVRTIAKFLMTGLLLLAVANLVTAIADANTVPPISLGDQSRALTANDVKPPECAGLDLVDVIGGSGIIDGTPGNDLILGSPGVDTIFGAGGDDCILGRGGADTLDGGPGEDICSGGTDPVTYTDCETILP
jgi:Ca2+-binding RTX toxin-like protein